MSFKFKLSVNILCVYKIDNALNLTGIILERIQVFILLAMENDFNGDRGSGWIDKQELTHVNYTCEK